MSNLAKIQAAIKAPKVQFNNFGKYKYRSCEDIVEAVKPVINPMGFHLTLSDEIINIGNRFYVKATATICNGDEKYSATGHAREEESKKGMDGAQVTGSASSYARKYALNGLFAIDDTKDADSTNKHDTDVFNDVPEPQELMELRKLVYNSTLDDQGREKALITIDACTDYKTYEKIKYRLEDVQKSIDNLENPLQRDIKKHIRNFVKP